MSHSEKAYKRIFSEEYMVVRHKLLDRFNEFLEDMKGKKAEDISPVEATNMRTIASFFETQDRLAHDALKREESKAIDFMNLVDEEASEKSSEQPEEDDGN